LNACFEFSALFSFHYEARVSIGVTILAVPSSYLKIILLPRIGLKIENIWVPDATSSVNPYDAAEVDHILAETP